MSPSHSQIEYHTWGVSGFAIGCPCNVWCRLLTTSLLYVCSVFKRLFVIKNFKFNITETTFIIASKYLYAYTLLCISQRNLHLFSIWPYSHVSYIVLFLINTTVLIFSVDMIWKISLAYILVQGFRELTSVRASCSDEYFCKSNKSGVKRLNSPGHLDQCMAQHGLIVEQSYCETV